MKLNVLFFVFAFLLSACASRALKQPDVISVLTFNTENLFDTEHDQNKLDYTYLPLALKKGALRKEVTQYCDSIKRSDWKKECTHLDWNEAKLSEKLRRIAQVISESTTGCPDVVILEEVENEKVLQRLNKMLACGYNAWAISDNRDVRGIDIGFLSRFNLKGSPTISIPFKNIDDPALQDTRGILDVSLYVWGTKMRILGVHLPAPFHPAELRKDSVAFMGEEFYKQPIPTIVAGDWNIPDKENIAENMLGSFRKNFEISDDTARSASNNQGSTYYEKESSWSFLDKIAFSRKHFEKVECQVVNFIPGQKDNAGHPKSFPLNDLKDLGVSDHFPILCRAQY